MRPHKHAARDLQSTCWMPYPQDWDAVEDKLKELYPTDLERGKVRKKLLDLDETKALKYFRDSDAAVKATLDEILKEGNGGAGAPNRHGPPPGRLLGSYSPMHQFVQALPEVREQVLNPVPGTVITLSCPWMGNDSIFGTQLYLRHCYGELLLASAQYQGCRPLLQGTLIAGTPGIGKSHMAGLVVAQLLLQGRVVLLELVPANSLPGSANRSYYRMQLTADGVASVHDVASHRDARQWLEYEHMAVNFDEDRAPAYVVDGGVPSLGFGTFPNAGRCFWQFSSAQPDILKEITKGANYQQFFPPLFSLAELKQLKAKVDMFAAHLSDDQVVDAYAILGGIARSVLLLQARGTSLADLRGHVKDKIAMMGEAGWKVVHDTLKGDTGFHEGSDLIVHWDAAEEPNIPPRSAHSPLEDRIRRYTRHRSQLASPFVAALLSIHMGLAKAETAAMFAVSHGTRGCAGGMVGTLHESLTHIFLAAGGEFECRLITSGKHFTLKLPQSSDVEVFQSTAEAVTLAAAPGASCYLMPASSTYPAIDALKTPAILFQVAAGKSHDINRPGLCQLVRGFGKDRMKAAVKDLRRMTELTAADLPGWRPVLFFATMPESFDDGFKALQKYVVGKKHAAQAPLANQAVLKIPHKLFKKMSAQEQTAIIAEVAKQLQQLFKQVNEGEEAAPAYMDED
ncbi:hypothetical protein COCOBI_13-0600 [Coccomyxa sp. Obi]|nr:hypothetical protein COCOBI_13-0600 [Coccomyxa sp. Obi]